MVKYLLVGEHEKNSIPELIFVEHPMKLITGFSSSVPVVRVDNKNQSLCILEVVAPQGSDFVLTADIPNSEIDILVFNRFHVEADGRDCGDNLAELQLIENGGLAGSIQSNHKDTHLLLGEKPLENTPEVPHCEELPEDFFPKNKNSGTDEANFRLTIYISSILP